MVPATSFRQLSPLEEVPLASKTGAGSCCISLNEKTLVIVAVVRCIVTRILHVAIESLSCKSVHQMAVHGQVTAVTQ